MIGAHEVHIEGDVLFNVMQGPFTKADMIAYLQHAESIIAEYGTFYAISDITHLQGIDAETRRYAAQWSRSHPIGGIVIHGGSLPMRSVVTLLIHAMNLFRTDKFPLVFVASPQEAEKWLAVRRQQQAATERGAGC